jgi:glutamyl-tRNA reductase
VSILLIGLNHRTAPVEIREQLAFSREGVATALLLFRNQFPQSEAAIISTCNRVEMVVASDSDRPNAADVLTFIAQARDLPVASFKPYLYQLENENACRHFFRVASGLDSMVLGESQIVNQVKQAFASASEQGTTGCSITRSRSRSACGRKRRSASAMCRSRRLPSTSPAASSTIFPASRRW